MTVPVLDEFSRPTGEELHDWEAAKYIAVLHRLVADLEGELLRRGFDESAETYRANQDCLCHCGKRYIEHPYGGPIVHERQMILHRLCNGDLVKL